MGLRDRIARLGSGRGHAAPPDEAVQRLEQRVAHLEAMVEGLQDAVHRDAIRHEERMLELERKTEPAELAKALSEDARRRGL